MKKTYFTEEELKVNKEIAKKVHEMSYKSVKGFKASEAETVIHVIETIEKNMAVLQKYIDRMNG